MWVDGVLRRLICPCLAVVLEILGWRELCGEESRRGRSSFSRAAKTFDIRLQGKRADSVCTQIEVCLESKAEIRSAQTRRWHYISIGLLKQLPRGGAICSERRTNRAVSLYSSQYLVTILYMCNGCSCPVFVQCLARYEETEQVQSPKCTGGQPRQAP